MELTKERLVCSKEQSIELLKYGAPSNTLFAWIEHKDEFGTLNALDENFGTGTPAYTIGELAHIVGLNFGTYDVRALADKVLQKLKQNDHVKVSVQ